MATWPWFRFASHIAKKSSRYRYLPPAAVILTLSMILTQTVHSEERPQVFYAGLAFAGNDASVPVNYLYSAKLAAEGMEGESLKKSLLALFTKNAAVIKGFDLKFDLAKEGESKTVMAVAVTGEGVSTELIGDVQKVVLDLSCQIVFLDFKELKVLGSYPVYVQYLTVSDGPPTEGFLLEQFRKLYLDPKFGVLHAIEERLGTLRVASASSRTIKLIKVDVEGDAAAQIPRGRLDGEAYQNQLAQRYGDVLSAKLGVTMLPYMKDSMTGTMALRMADGQSIMFKVDDPTYGVDLTLRNFKKVPYKETAAEAAWIYGAYITVKIYEPEFNKIFMEEKIKHGETKIVPRTQTNVDDFAAFDAVLNILLHKSTDTIRQNDKAREVILKCAAN